MRSKMSVDMMGDGFSEYMQEHGLPKDSWGDENVRAWADEQEARAKLATEGVKYDSGKLRMDLLPPDAIAMVAAVLTYGAAKYADRNWEKGMDIARLDAAAARHKLYDALGEAVDPETGLLHRAHAACCELMALALLIRGTATDNSCADVGDMGRQNVREALRAMQHHVGELPRAA